jgi:translation elongation factor EF-G
VFFFLFFILFLIPHSSFFIPLAFPFAGVPCIAFVNKMDRDGASLDTCLSMMKEKLSCTPLPLQFCVTSGLKFNSVVDIVAMRKLEWAEDRTMTVTEMQQQGDLWAAAKEKRERLCELLADLDDKFAEVCTRAKKWKEREREWERKGKRVRRVKESEESEESERE